MTYFQRQRQRRLFRGFSKGLITFRELKSLSASGGPAEGFVFEKAKAKLLNFDRGIRK